ncbi:MAG: 1,3-beta-galactosyl-N-acetylhexosamine phosphorylase [Oceanipulchritudo sp.]
MKHATNSESTNRTHTSGGSITLPAESGQETTVRELLQLWKADAIRDSDGTQLSPELKGFDLDIYSTICLVRAEQNYPRNHFAHLPQKYLMSDPVHARGERLEIDLLKGYHREKYAVDTLNSAHEFWEVIDRSTGERVSPEKWDLEADSGRVIIRDCLPYHLYTVSFLVFLTWDTTSMYNHLTNGWTGDHVMSVDPYHRECREFLMDYFDKWLAAHDETTVVRLTTLAYHFGVDNLDAEQALDRFRDWTGYQDTISIQALKDFKAEFGYQPTPEDFVDAGFYNHTSRVPTPAYLDWIHFIHRFVVDFGKELVAKVHASGKKAGIFWGDHWTGVEPYSPLFQEMGIDIHIGAAEDGVALRRVSDAPGDQVKELRLYPYFFPDVFSENGNPVRESMENWIKIRRALLRKPVDRIGYGGYLSLAAKFPDFVDHVSQICDEFRLIKACSSGQGSWKAPVKVAILNAWGPLRAWINSFGVPQKFLEKRVDVIAVAGTNLLECLAGLPLEISWLSFEDILGKGIPGDVDVLINDGDAETAWSGGSWWRNPAVTAAVREFVARGGGVIGCRGPSAHFFQGSHFQLKDVLGVEKELGHSVQSPPVELAPPEPHFITRGLESGIDLGPGETDIFPVDPNLVPLRTSEGHIQASANVFEAGRAVFFSALPYNLENAEMLYRAILWAAGREKVSTTFRCSNPLTDCAYFPDSDQWVVVNNSPLPQSTEIHAESTSWSRSLAPFEVVSLPSTPRAESSS